LSALLSSYGSNLAQPPADRGGDVVQRRDVYLKIERLLAYSPVAPDDAEHHRYRVDCMHGMDHEDGTIPVAEIERRRLDAVVFRQYRDAGYTDLETAPLVAADINEPRAERRIPGTFIYTQPGEGHFAGCCGCF
jgi:hypothetical protein